LKPSPIILWLRTYGFVFESLPEPLRARQPARQKAAGDMKLSKKWARWHLSGMLGIIKYL
jgi:hypothetical protein